MRHRLPTFLVVGAAKSGTTALYYFLREHPQVFMSPVKEPNYFAFDGVLPSYAGPGDLHFARLNGTVLDSDRYAALFAGATAEHTAVGEASPLYLYDTGAAARIRARLPEARIVAILRNPIDRAYSQYLHQVRDGREPCSSFEEALREEPSRVARNWGPFWHYAMRGNYFEQLQRYFDRFDRERVRVYLYDDFVADPAALVADLFEFIGVDPAITPDLSRRYNESGVPRRRGLHALLRKPIERGLVPHRVRSSVWMQRLGGFVHRRALVKPEMECETRERLRERFWTDVEQLGRLIDRDLSHWLG